MSPRAAVQHPGGGAERGAAIITAMLTVTLVATLAAAALWQQWRGVEVEAAERGRMQAAWVLSGSLDWARLILREDARGGGPDHLGEPWAVALQEARLSSFLAADRANTGDWQGLDDAFLSGQITDAQSRLNVTSLIDGGRISEPAMHAFAKLFDLLGLPQEQLARMAENLRFASDTSAANQSGPLAPLLPQRVEQLTWLGLPATSVAALAPYVTLLPLHTPVNLNTASAQVIYASVPDLDMTDAQRLVALRQRQPLRTLDDAVRLLPALRGQLGDGMHSVASRYFEVRGRLRMEQAVVEEHSLLQRDGMDVRALWRDRGVPAGAATPAAN